MPKILLAAASGALDNLAALLEEEAGEKVHRANTAKEALAMARKQALDLVVLEENLPDMSYLEAVQELLKINAFINTAVVTGLSEEDFHEQSEGLGILAGLGPGVDRDQVKQLMDQLRLVSG